ncbi:MAG: Do family serine endopeptidase [Proteobacteria bacterium]|nr:Do family serine endopeptidase [Pseudomonadota bacterium]
MSTKLSCSRGLQDKLVLVLMVFLSWSASAAAPPTEPGQLPDFETLVRNERDSVVNIQTRGQITATNSPYGGSPSDLSEFLRRFREFGAPGQPSSPAPQEGLGSGVIASSDGYILTNAHVVNEAAEIIVRLNDQRELPANLIGADAYSDIAVLKVNATGLRPAKFGDSDDLNVGQWVLAIGAPFGLEQTATQGIISAVSRSLPNDNYVPFIQTDVAVNPGNSGGPLFNLQGQVIGINSQIFSRTGGYMGLSFAIPINLATSISERLKVNGSVERGWLGIAIQDLNQALADSFGLDSPRGALISDVSPNSPAARAELKTGDVIVEFAGRAIERSGSLPPIVASTPANSETTMRIIRGRETKTVKITVGLLENAQLASAEQATGPLGIVVSDITRSDQEAIGVEHGVRVDRVESGKPAAEAGLQSEDIIVSFNHQPIDNVAELTDLSRSATPGSTVAVLVQRQQQVQFLALKIPANQPG